MGFEDGGDGRHLGLSVEVPEPQLGKALRDLLEHLDRHRRCAVVALLERGQVTPVEVRVSKQRDPHCRGAEQLCDPLGLDGLQEGRRLSAAEDDAGRSQVDVRGEEAVQLRAVIEGQGVGLDVGLAHPPVDDCGDVLRDQGATRQRHALRAGLRPTRVHELKGVVIGDFGQGFGCIRAGHPRRRVIPARRSLLLVE